MTGYHPAMVDVYLHFDADLTWQPGSLKTFFVFRIKNHDSHGLSQCLINSHKLNWLVVSIPLKNISQLG
jgi:hypothetical protein